MSRTTDECWFRDQQQLAWLILYTKMAIPLSLKSFLADLRLDPFLGLHLLQARVLFFKLFKSIHHGRIHATVLRLPPITTGSPNTVVWRHQISNGWKHSRKRIAAWNRCSRISAWITRSWRMWLKKAVKLAIRRDLVDYVRQEYEVSIRRARRIVGISCSVYRYKTDTRRDDEVIAVLQLAVER